MKKLLYKLLVKSLKNNNQIKLIQKKFELANRSSELKDQKQILTENS